MIKCKSEIIFERLKVLYISNGKEISFDELKEFCETLNLKFGLVKIGSNGESLLLETERGSVSIDESGEIQMGKGIYEQFAEEWYDTEMLEKMIREDINGIECGEKDIICFGTPTLEV